MAAPSSGSWNGRAAYLLVEIFSPCKRRLLPPLLFFMVLCCVYAPVSPSLTPRLDTAAIDAVKAGRGLFLEDDSGILCALSDAQLVNSSGQASRKGGWVRRGKCGVSSFSGKLPDLLASALARLRRRHAALWTAGCLGCLLPEKFTGHVPRSRRLAQSSLDVGLPSPGAAWEGACSSPAWRPIISSASSSVGAFSKWYVSDRCHNPISDALLVDLASHMACALVVSGGTWRSGSAIE